MEVECAAPLTEEEKAELHPGVDAARLDKFLARIPATSRKHALRLIGFEAGPDDTEEDVRKVVERWWTAKHN